MVIDMNYWNKVIKNIVIFLTTLTEKTFPGSPVQSDILSIPSCPAERHAVRRTAACLHGGKQFGTEKPAEKQPQGPYTVQDG